MTREEQLNNEIFTSVKELANNKPFLNTEMGQYVYQLGFEYGVNWVDENPKEGLVYLDKVYE